MQCAYFDPITRKVIGWFDTEAFDCVLPDESMLLQLNELEWALNAGTDRWITDVMTLSPFEPVVVVTLDQLRAEKLAEISAACAAEIVGGFDCSALGVVYRYPSQPTDQSNLMAAVLSSLTAGDDAWTTPVWCVDTQGIGDYRFHNVQQVQAVGNASLSARNAALTKKAALDAQVAQAAKAAEIPAISWTD